MPISKSQRKLACFAAGEQEMDEPAAAARLPAAVPAAPESADPGRPHRVVEAEARQYWQDMLNPGSLVKPGREELRAAAMPVLARGLRRRQDRLREPAFYLDRARRAASALQMHLIERLLDHATVFPVVGLSQP